MKYTEQTSISPRNTANLDSLSVAGCPSANSRFHLSCASRLTAEARWDGDGDLAGPSNTLAGEFLWSTRLLAGGGSWGPFLFSNATLMSSVGAMPTLEPGFGKALSSSSSPGFPFGSAHAEMQTTNQGPPAHVSTVQFKHLKCAY